MTAKVLVIDDNQTIRVLLAQILTQEGFAASLAANGAVALPLLDECRFDLIIVDFHMPEMAGDEFVRRVREHRDPAVRRTPVLGLSGSHKDADQLFARAGATACIRKPFVEERLLSAVQRLVERRA